jgi:hypothetical protein
MTMANKALPQFLLGAGVVAALAAGFWLIGGPEAARMENRDQNRMSDLHSLQDHVTCLARTKGKVLPQVLDETRDCPAPRLTGRLTDDPYRYARLSETAYEICADFELPDRLRPSPRFDVETGCLRGTYTAD